MKRKTKASPMKMSLGLLRADGWTCAITEHWNPHARIRQDAFGWMDILAYRGGETIGVQSTTGSNAAARELKMASLLKGWNTPSHRHAVLHSWSKTGPRGKRKVWTCKEVWL